MSLVLLNGEKMQIFPIINLCIKNFCFCTCEFLWVKPDGVLMKKSWLLFLLSISVVLMFIFIKKSPKKVSETITRDRLQLIYSFFFKLEDKLINICERNHLWYGFEIDWFVFLQQTMWSLQTVQPLHRFTGCSYIRLLHKCRLVGETTVLYHPATVWVLHNGAHIVYKCQR